jgi:hypothetical protein
MCPLIRSTDLNGLLCQATAQMAAPLANTFPAIITGWWG